MIEIRDLTIKFGEKTILDGFNATFPDSGIVIIRGESGIGKTTLLRTIAGLLRPQKGSITGLENRKLSFVFQEPRLIANKTALYNAALASDKETALEILQRLGIDNLKDEMSENLSGGEKQRVSLARAFAYSTDVVLLDEPFTGLDEENRQRAAELIETAKLTILVTHDKLEDGFFQNAFNVNL